MVVLANIEDDIANGRLFQFTYSLFYAIKKGTEAPS